MRNAIEFPRAASLLLLLVASSCLPAADAPEVEGAMPDEQRAVASTAQGLSYRTVPQFPLGTFPLEIKSVGTGLCLETAATQGDYRSTVHQAACTREPNQTWFLVPTGYTSYQIRSGAVGGVALIIEGSSIKVKEVESGDNWALETWGLVEDPVTHAFQIALKSQERCVKADGTTGIVRGECTGSSTRLWELKPHSHSMNLVAAHSSLCLELPDASWDDNVALRQQECWERMPKQRWGYVNAAVVNGAQYVRIFSGSSGKCIDVLNGSTAIDAQIVQKTCSSTATSQQWLVQDYGADYTRLVNRRSGLCAEVTGGSGGADIRQRTCSSASSQRWFWANYLRRLIQVVQVGPTNQSALETVGHQPVQDQKGYANTVWMPYGIRLMYNNDRIKLYNDAIYALNEENATDSACPTDGVVRSPGQCAWRYAANWPERVVLFITPANGGHATPNGAWIRMDTGAVNPAGHMDCGVEHIMRMGHELGHYLGLPHTFVTEDTGGDGDGLSQTMADDGNDVCSGPTGPYGYTEDGVQFQTNNIMSYYRNVAHKVYPQQAVIARVTAYIRLRPFF